MEENKPDFARLARFSHKYTKDKTPEEITVHLLNLVWESHLKEKHYTAEDMTEFGLWLGSNIKKHTDKSIDDLFKEFVNG